MAGRKQSVAVVGASSDRGKFSNKAVRAYQEQGWDVYPVNPKGGEIENLKAFVRIEDIPLPIDRVTLYLSPAMGLTVLPGIARKKPRELYFNPGADSDELVAAAKKLGLSPILACSIVEIGVSPSHYPD